MIKYKKNKKTLKGIGKKWYGFDFELERNIYCYLCCIRVKNRELRKINKELKFESYKQWNTYVRNKYKNFDKDILIEFKRYLNQQIRNISPVHEYRNITATVVLTVFLTSLVDKLFSLKISYEELSGISAIVAILVLELFVAIPMAFAIVQITKPIFESSVDVNFLRDYKEIIDELITEK